MMDQAIRVNAQEISASAIAAEMQFHPAATQKEAWRQAAWALAIRALLLQEADRLDVIATADADEGMDEARIRALLARAVNTLEPDEDSCRRWFKAHPGRYRGRDVYEAAHILLAAAPDDARARDEARTRAVALITTLSTGPEGFADLARVHSACGSAGAGGVLGQMGRGDLVDEVETFILAMEPGQLCPVPVMSRYGAHVLRLDRLERGAAMDFATAHPFVERELRARSWQAAVSQYLHALVGRARIEGVALDRAAA